LTNALLAVVTDVQVVDRVPEVKLEPAPNQKFKPKLLPLSLSNAPVVSPSNVIVFFSQVFVVFTV
jgi:hypothetical protein